MLLNDELVMEKVCPQVFLYPLKFQQLFYYSVDNWGFVTVLGELQDFLDQVLVFLCD